MKTYRLILLLFILPVLSLSARGAIERDREFREELESTCTNLFYNLESDKLTPEEAKDQLAELRSRFSRPFTDSDGILESMIDQVSESLLSADQALFEFNLLKQGKLMTYRQEQNTSASLTNSSRSGNSTGPSRETPSSGPPSEPPSDRGNSGKGGG
ncbi:MAG: hypothetical protein JXR86_20810 [Spirochaetales bacterium]|nr:hypothetical protein [Spirochaetales bacterium]